MSGSGAQEDRVRLVAEIVRVIQLDGADPGRAAETIVSFFEEEAWTVALLRLEVKELTEALAWTRARLERQEKARAEAAIRHGAKP